MRTRMRSFIRVRGTAGEGSKKDAGTEAKRGSRSFKTPAGKKRKKHQPQSSRGGKKKGKGVRAYFSKGRPGSTR